MDLHILKKVLKLSHVPRWSIVDMLKEQSVADHSFRMVAIYVYLHQLLGLGEPNGLCSVLFHDVDEAETGDMPSNHKNGNTFTVEDIKNRTICQLVMDLADTLEAKIWLERYGVNPYEIDRFLEKKIYVISELLAEKLEIPSGDMDIYINEVLDVGRNYS